MINYIPVITTVLEGLRGDSGKISFDVTIVNVDTINNDHTTYGGGSRFTGLPVGKASVILERSKTVHAGLGGAVMSHGKEPINVVFFSGYREDEKEFSEETEKDIIEVCKTAAKVFWG